ncbi:MAG: efflux RND transporter periplasmic adaptor subunit [Hyphomicrobiaceae bacterium]
MLLDDQKTDSRVKRERQPSSPLSAHRTGWPAQVSAMSKTLTPPWLRLGPWTRWTLIAALALAAGLWLARTTAQPRLDTVAPVRGTAVLAVYGTGQVEPVTWARLAAVQTARLVAFRVAEGEQVQSGQVLALQDDAVERAILGELEARARLLTEELNRKLVLVERTIIPRAQVDELRAQREEALARVEAQKYRIARMQLVSPIDGVVLRREGELGELIEAGRPVIWVGDPTELQVTATIDEEDIATVRQGQTVLVKSDAFPDRVVRGAVSHITLQGDPVGKTFRIRISLPPETGLMVGMTTDINIVVREAENARLLPVSSVLDGHVYIIDRGRIQRLPVETGIRSEAQIEIVSGISDDTVVVRDAEQARRRLERS